MNLKAPGSVPEVREPPNNSKLKHVCNKFESDINICFMFHIKPVDLTQHIKLVILGGTAVLVSKVDII